MPTLVACPSCEKKLKLPDGTTAKKVRCPGCGEVISVAKSGITAKLPATPPRKDEEPRSRTADKGIRKEPPSDVKPRARPDNDDIQEEEPDDEEPRPRKVKRKRRKKAKKGGPEIPWWLYAGVAGTILLFFGIMSAAFIHAGYGKLLLAFVVGMAIILPVSVVILVISMFIASALLGGVDFGEAHVAIPKACVLLFVVNLLSMVPLIGPFLALPVWFLGLMGLFGLDFVETRILVAVNWILNTLFKYFILAVILSALLHGKSSEDSQPVKVPSGEAAAVKKIEALGGSCDADEDEDESGHIVAVSLDNKPVEDASLTLLRSFPKLQSLSLAQTRITDEGLREVATHSTLEHLDLSGDMGVTDAGLDHLAALPRLQMLVLSGTRVTEAGVQKLRAARPGLRVVR